MKKILIISALALVALASCTKNNLLAPELKEQEISYQAVIGSMSTKAGDNTFSPSAGFKSYVYQHQNSVSAPEEAANKLNKILAIDQWTAAVAGAQATYISDANITLIDGAWQAGTKYYWPKASYLTFFAWADGVNATPSVSNVSFTHTEGIKVDDYSVTINKNKDFMVAEVAYNQTSNTSAHGSWANGVPTIFHHQMSQFKFTATTDENYETPAASAHSFYVTKITFKNIMNVGDYTQLIDPATATSSWSNQATPTEFVMFNAQNDPENSVVIPGAAVNGVKVGVNGVKVDLKATANEFEILLPQTFASSDLADPNTSYIEVEYWAVDKIGATDVAKKMENKKAAIKTAYAADWAQEHKYTLNLIFGLEEVLWDPATEVWKDGSTTDVVIK